MKTIKILLLFCTFVIFLSGCDLLSGGEEDISAEELLTAVVQTVEAALSLTPQPTNTNTATATATATATFTPSPSLTSSPTIQVIESRGGDTGGQANCDSSTFVTDVSIPDGTQFAPGEVFTKTWRLQNSGSCAWTSQYGVVFTSGAQMNGVSPTAFTNLGSNTVAAGATLDISVEMTAPSTNGTYRWYWRMQNTGGNQFGYNFYVEIVVATGTGPTMTPTATATGPTPTPGPTNTPGGPTKPDMKINQLAYAPTGTNREYDVTVVIENQGTDAGNFLVEWWSGEEAGNTPANTWNTSLAGNSTKELKYTYTYNNYGTYSTKVFVDSTLVIDESNEGNNEHTSTHEVK